MSSGNDSEDELRCAGCSKRYIKKAELNFHTMHCKDYTHYMQSFEKTSTRIGRSAAQIAKSFQDRRKRKAAAEPESSSDSTSSSESDRDSGPSTRLQASDYPSSTNDDYADESQHLYEEDDISMQAASEPDDTTVDLVQERSASEPAGTSSVPLSPNLSDNASESNISDDGINRPAPWRNVAPQSPLGDELPEGPTALEEEQEEQDDNDDDAPAAIRSGVQDHERTNLRIRITLKVKTAANRFGLSRIYARRPTAVPDLNLPSSQLNNQKLPRRKPRKIRDIIWPFPNVSAFMFGHWRRSGSNQKSDAECKKLQDIITNPSFRASDIQGVNFAALDEQIAHTEANPDAANPWQGSGWRTSSVSIAIPRGRKKTKEMKKKLKEADRRRKRLRRLGGDDDDGDDESDELMGPLTYVVNNVHSRSLTHIVTSWATDPDSKTYHWHGFAEHWQPPGNRPIERVYSDITNSPAFVETEKDLNASPPEPGCDLPRAIMHGWHSLVPPTGDLALWIRCGYVEDPMFQG